MNNWATVIVIFTLLSILWLLFIMMSKMFKFESVSTLAYICSLANASLTWRHILPWTEHFNQIFNTVMCVWFMFKGQWRKNSIKTEAKDTDDRFCGIITSSRWKTAVCDLGLRNLKDFGHSWRFWSFFIFLFEARLWSSTNNFTPSVSLLT